MNYTILTEKELSSHVVGAAITIGAVMAIATAVIAAVVVLKLLFSKEGSTTIPGGWKFVWE